MQTDINSQRKKSSSRKKRLTKNEAPAKEISKGAWWPFTRVDGKLLQKLHKAEVNRNQEDALL